jgi:hypothetical protein
MTSWHPERIQVLNRANNRVSQTLSRDIVLGYNDRISIEAETRGLPYSGDYTYSLIGRVKVHIVGPLSLAAGYRHDYIKFDMHDIDSEGTFSGPFIETVLIFK